MITYASGTRAGGLHEENQDRLAADPAAGTFVVADGIGGLADAALTARAVVEQLPLRVCERVTAIGAPGAARAAAEAAAELNDRVRDTARSGPGTTGAATALLLVRGGLALAVHLGDSRIYLARDGLLARLTDDHVHEGRLTRFVGMPGRADPDVSVHELSAGDRVLLCTDGLVHSVGDEELRAILTTAGDVEGVCERLLGAAAAGGAIDDVSVIAVQYGTGRWDDGAAQQR
ncbi:PP2C family protein-serine/threonine phosphatase [Nonomuraea angiospora]|uniref:Protein phosphatase n=1 Tax=Nonomuraea angiospora TaxID=46172 RepID=A0ABR9MK69_9ACTN|nr:protein phosphatase 2C domain-containing protein [Nonomuraea angiospora]MBE1593326.1 protein phosphatase [Nonomuraea angiospora]